VQPRSLRRPQGIPQDKDIALEEYEEHHVVDMIVAEIDGVAYDDEQ
jgi:hypothetical protein